MFDADVEAALASLAPDFRAAVVLCDVEGLTYEEIADVLGLKLGTVRSRIHRGRAQLRTALAHRAPRPGRTRFAGPRLTGPRPRRTGAVMLSLSGHIGSQGVGTGRRPAPPCRGGAGLVARPDLPRLSPAGRARGLDQASARLPLGTRVAVDPPPQLLGSLYAVDAWAAVDADREAARAVVVRPRSLVGGGAVGACVLGLLTVTGGPVGRSDVPARPSPAMIRGDQPRGPVGSPTGAETNTSPDNGP